MPVTAARIGGYLRTGPAIAGHTVPVMAALAICAVTAALLHHRTDTQAPPPVHPD
jgi:hypothetical protein